MTHRMTHKMTHRIITTQIRKFQHHGKAMTWIAHELTPEERNTTHYYIWSSLSESSLY